MLHTVVKKANNDTGQSGGVTSAGESQSSAASSATVAPLLISLCYKMVFTESTIQASYTVMDYISQGSSISVSCFLISMANSGGPRLASGSESHLHRSRLRLVANISILVRMNNKL